VPRCPAIAVIGGARAGADSLRDARRVGRLLAESGALVVTGGMGGVMEAASQGAAQAGGICVGILPGSDAAESPPNPYLHVPVYTGMGDARNAIVVRSAHCVIAIGGGFGTLSEIGLALKAGRPVVLLRSWKLAPPDPIPENARLLRAARTPQEAVKTALALASLRKTAPRREGGWEGPDAGDSALLNLFPPSGHNRAETAPPETEPSPSGPEEQPGDQTGADDPR